MKGIFGVMIVFLSIDLIGASHDTQTAGKNFLPLIHNGVLSAEQCGREERDILARIKELICFIDSAKKAMRQITFCFRNYQYEPHSIEGRRLIQFLQDCMLKLKNKREEIISIHSLLEEAIKKIREIESEESVLLTMQEENSKQRSDNNGIEDCPVGTKMSRYYIEQIEQEGSIIHKSMQQFIQNIIDAHSHLFWVRVWVDELKNNVDQGKSVTKRVSGWEEQLGQRAGDIQCLAKEFRELLASVRVLREATTRQERSLTWPIS